MQKKHHQLFINVCKWAHVPRPKKDSDPIPVKGGTLRHLVKDHQKTGHLLFDIAFNPYVVQECCKDKELECMLLNLSLDFVSDFAKVEIDRPSCKKLKAPFKGPQEELQYSLNDHSRHLLAKESQLDIGDSILEELHRITCGNNEEVEAKNSSTLPLLKLPCHKGIVPGRKLIEELPASSKDGMEGQVKRPDHSVEVVTEEGIERVRVTVNLPGVTSVREVELDVSQVSM